MDDERGEILWHPDGADSAMARFASEVGMATHHELHRWSVDDLPGFWGAVAEFTGVQWRTAPERVLVDATMPGASWFPSGTLNYAEHVFVDRGRADQIAVRSRTQTRDASDLTWAELRAAVERCRTGLRRLGVTSGDRVAAYAPNIAETLIAFLASASLGAVWSSCAPEFGTRSVVDRLSQIEPKVLLAVDGYHYGPKAVDRRVQVREIIDALPSLEAVVSLPYLSDGLGDAATTSWGELLAGEPEPLAFEAVPFEHPLYVLYSSGTTGLPKPIVHGHGGITVEHLKVLTLHQDLTPDDTFFWFSTTGWMMWNYLVSGLMTGATIVCFDGDPGAPDLLTLWNVAAETETTVFGASAPFLMACRAADLAPARGDIRWVGSTGAPLPPDGFRWVDRTLGVPVSSISGGTDVCSAFVGTSPLVPVRAGEISCSLLGCAVEAFGPDGDRCPAGVTGELVITQPMPSMPVGFWGDDDGSRYRAAYFEDYPGVWRHGDWITFTDDGACTITGRSDATLNRGGVRLGTSDFYAVVEDLPEITDSLVVHLDHLGSFVTGVLPDHVSVDGAGALVLFVVLADDAMLDDGLVAQITRSLRGELSPRHAPDAVIAVGAVPRTLSGKKLELPVKRILEGDDPDVAASRGALADPSALDIYTKMVQR